MADSDEKTEETKIELSPEERIAKLEKGKLLRLILIIVLIIFSIIQFAGIGYLLATSAKDPRVGTNTVQLATLDAKVIELQKTSNEAKKIILQNEVIKIQMEKLLKDANIHNYARLRSTMVDQEISNLQFLEALKQGMYELSRMVRGSRTWYEVYKEELDILIEDSDARIAKIEGEGPLVQSKAAP